MQSTKRPLLIAIIPALVCAIAAPAWAAVNDPDFPVQWALKKVQAEQAWSTSTGRGITVAVLDSGVDFSHPEFVGKSAGSFNCYSNPCAQGGVGSTDRQGHGTSVASVIAAVTNNDEGMASVAPDAKILSLRVCGGSDGTSGGCGSVGDPDVIPRAIRFAIQKGAKVINMSLGSIAPGGDNIDVSTFKSAWDSGVVTVVASGNQEGQPISAYGGLSADYLLIVGSTGPNDEVASYSSGSSTDLDVDVYAPGGNSCSASADGKSFDYGRCILTAAPGGKYHGVQGTSFAAPHVAGVAAQLRCLGKNVDQTHDLIKRNVDRPGGIPRLNALRAVNAAGGGGDCAASFPVSTVKQPTSGTKTTAPTGGVGQAKPGQPAANTPGAPGQAAQPGAPASEQNPTAGEIAEQAEEKKSNKTLINVLIGVALVAAIGSWYGYTKWKASRAPAD